MCRAFVNGLIKAGYNSDEIFALESEIQLVFDKPRTTQPVTRTEVIEKFNQMKNKLLCDKYLELTKGYAGIQEKLKAVKAKEPDLYKSILNIGKPKDLYNIFEAIKDYLD
jgi:hypothetical protein